MGLFDKMFGNGKKQICSKDVIDIMIAMADAMMDQGDYERAVDTYKNILELEPNITAQYNLGSLYAQGKGVPQNFLEGAYWFRQANMAGDEQAGKLCINCMMDYAHSNFSAKTPKDLFDDMIHFVTYIYPKENAVQLAGENLYDLGTNHLRVSEHDTLLACLGDVSAGNRRVYAKPQPGKDPRNALPAKGGSVSQAEGTAAGGA